VSVEGFKSGPDTDTNSRFNETGPGYFATLGIPLLAGRDFTRGDALTAPKVTIVNEAFAKKFNLGRDAVGKHMSNKGDNSPLVMEIVGLVKNAKYSDVKREIPPLFFQPYRQDENIGSINFYVRTGGDPERFVANILKVVARLDANLPVENLRTLPQQVRENVFLDRFISVLSAAFACLATLLAAVGLYGVLAYTVSQRTREIGLRMALGAPRAAVVRLVVREGMTVGLAGVGAGIAAALALSRALAGLVFGVPVRDPMTFAGVTAVLVTVALAACSLPARRASRVEPIIALRED
jgi:predicted permease